LLQARFKSIKFEIRPEELQAELYTICCKLALDLCIIVVIVVTWLQARFNSSKFEIRPEELQSLEAELSLSVASMLYTFAHLLSNATLCHMAAGTLQEQQI
jgi:hypothetical protein